MKSVLIANTLVLFLGMHNFAHGSSSDLSFAKQAYSFTTEGGYTDASLEKIRTLLQASIPGNQGNFKTLRAIYGNLYRESIIQGKAALIYKSDRLSRATQTTQGLLARIEAIISESSEMKAFLLSEIAYSEAVMSLTTKILKASNAPIALSLETENHLIGNLVSGETVAERRQVEKKSMEMVAQAAEQKLILSKEAMLEITSAITRPATSPLGSLFLLRLIQAQPQLPASLKSSLEGLRFYWRTFDYTGWTGRETIVGSNFKMTSWNIFQGPSNWSTIPVYGTSYTQENFRSVEPYVVDVRSAVESLLKSGKFVADEQFEMACDPSLGRLSR